jgi:hypothetical protein
MSIRESSSDFSRLLVMTPAAIPQKPCEPSSSIERALTASSVPRASPSLFARSYAFSVLLGDALPAWNMRFLDSPHGGSHQSPGFSLPKM